MPFSCAISVWAQLCPHDNVFNVVFKNVFKAAPQEQTLHAGSADDIFRYAAISGEMLAPTLRQLSKPGMPVDSVAGAAQASLARLGDKGALDQLEKELNGPNSTSNAVSKLVRAGSDKALSILMGYLRAHVSDNSLYHDFGDYATDVRSEITEGISEQLQIGPVRTDGFLGGSLQDWLTWWDQNRGKSVTLSISGDFRDPYLKCLARKVEWGFPDAIFDMEQTHEPQVIPVLRLLAKWGNPKRRAFVVTTLQGRAQLGLARLGDLEEVENVKRELDLPGWGGAIEELRNLGGPVAVKMLIDALDSPNYLPEYRGTPGYKKLELERDGLIAVVLAGLVHSPPQATDPLKAKKLWQDWWSRNSQDPAHFVVLPQRTYE
jgi:HEAT repeat protein